MTRRLSAGSGLDLHRAERLVNAALNDAECRVEPPKGRSELCCMSDRAMVNLTSYYLERIYGRVSIEIDPR